MLIAKQIERIILQEAEQAVPTGIPPLAREAITRAAEKIAALSDDNGAAVAAAMLENEVTSTLMDMTVATVLATLIEEEGGGRSNVSISPMSMDHMQQHYLYEVRNDGMIRHVSIKMREDSPLQDEENWRKPSHRHGLVDSAPTPPHSVDDLKPQAAPKVHDRPVWAVRDGAGLHDMDDEAAAKAFVLKSVDPIAAVENRYCLHEDCPSTGCNHSEATSDADGA